MLKYLFSIVIATIAFVGLTACEQDKTTPPSIPALVVDLSAIAGALGADDQIQQKLNEAEKQLNSQLNEISSNLTSQLKEKQAELNQKSKKDQATLEELTRVANLQLLESQERARAQANQYKLQLVEDFRRQVLAAALPIAETRGALSVVTAHANLLWHDPSIDITDEVIGVMRELPITIDVPTAASNHATENKPTTSDDSTAQGDTKVE